MDNLQRPTASDDADFASIEHVERDAWIDMVEAAPDAVRKSLGLACRRIGEAGLVICGAIDHMQFNRLAALGLTRPASPGALDAALAEFTAAGVRNGIVQCPDGLTDLADLCSARGLVPHQRTWAKFQRGPGPVEARTELEVREIGPAEGAAFGAAVAAGFGLPPSVAAWVEPLSGRAGWRCFAAFDGAAMVAAGALYRSGAAAWLGLGATLPTHRRRGAQSALLAARIAAATGAGCRLLTTETGVPHEGEAGPSFKNIQAAGFKIAYLRPNYCRPG